MRGEFRPWPKAISPETHEVRVGGVVRTDYREEWDDEGQLILLDGLTYEECCNVQIVPIVRRKWS